MNFSCIYRLQCKDKEITEFYIGSTKHYSIRKRLHKCDCTNINSNEYNRKIYKFMREHGGWDNWEMIVEVKTPNHTKEERIILEQIFLEIFEPTLNCYNSSGKNKNLIKKYVKIREKCPICEKELLKVCMTRHIRTIHNL